MTVQNLQPYTTYQLRVVASNVVGRSVPSSSTRLFITKEDVPTSAPADVDARSIDAKSITVYWVVGFKIVYDVTILFSAHEKPTGFL